MKRTEQDELLERKYSTIGNLHSSIRYLKDRATAQLGLEHIILEEEDLNEYERLYDDDVNVNETDEVELEVDHNIEVNGDAAANGEQLNDGPVFDQVDTDFSGEHKFYEDVSQNFINFLFLLFDFHHFCSFLDLG